MRLYWEVARRAFRRYVNYRAATYAGIFTNTIFGLIQAYILLAVYRQRPDVGGFSAIDSLTFVFVTQGLLMTVNIFPSSWIDIGERIRTGDVISDLYRPVDFHLWWLAHDLGRASFHALARGIPPFLVGALVFDLRLPERPETWGMFAVSAALAVTVCFGIRFMVNLVGFWLLDVRGAAQLVGTVVLFLSGCLLPIVFFPDWLETLARVLPFSAIIQAPIEVFLEKRTGTDLIVLLAGQAAWAFVLAIAGRALLAAATRKVVIQGG